MIERWAPEGGAIVQVGKSVEITVAEAVMLLELAKEMQAQSRHQSKGWFLQYLQAHKAAHRIIKKIFTRSHAN